MRYAIYSTTSGEIRGVVSCSEEDSVLQVSDGEALLQMLTGDDSTHYVDAGVLVEKPAQPSEAHVFDWVSKAWVDPRTLEDFKSIKWDEIKSTREYLINQPMVTPYGTVDSNSKAQANITSAILLVQTLVGLSLPASVDFTLANNETVTLTAEEMTTVGLMLGQKIQTIRGIATSLRADIEAATTIETLEAITWPI